MTTVLYVVIYLSVLSFLIACTVRTIMYARQPLHLRWELYPVPHEEPERVKHGGSYFETLDWWLKPSKFNWVTEMKFMAPEILFLKGLWEFNRKLWFRSFPFHFGLYLLMGAICTVALSALLAIFAPGVMGGVAGAVLTLLYSILGAFGASLALFGPAQLHRARRRLQSRFLRSLVRIPFGLLSPASSGRMLLPDRGLCLAAARRRRATALEIYACPGAPTP